MWDGKLLFALLAAAVLSALAGRLIAALFRRRMRLAMAGGPPPVPQVPPPGAAFGATAAARKTPLPGLAANRAARARLAAVLLAISLAIGVTQSAWGLALVYGGGPYGVSVVKWLLLGLVDAWVAVPVLGALWRWSWWRTAAWSAVWLMVAGSLVAMRSDDALLTIWRWLAMTQLPLLVLVGVAASGQARATGPYALPVFLLLCGASVMGTDLLAWLVATPAAQPWLVAAAEPLGVTAVLVAFALAPWVVAAAPAWLGMRTLARAYEARRFSEPVYWLAGYWLVALLLEALSASHSIGAWSLTVILCALWVPLGMRIARPWLAAPATAPTLLVLRVFQRDAATQALFDRVVDRFRASGPVELIAGTDLALSTLDPDDLFAFVGGKLAGRFVASEADLAHRLATLDHRPDRDGRFRVHEFYCFDSTWKPTLAALAGRADRVLMDLRGLASRNAGCLHELAVLAAAEPAPAVLLLFDAATDRPAAEAAIGPGATRFEWFDATRFGRRDAGRVLARLLA